MDSAIDELAALGRIIQVLKHFRLQCPDSQPGYGHAKEAYLKKCLSDRDWLFWKEIQEASSDLEGFTDN